MSAMLHSVIAKDAEKNILQVITCFSEAQIPIAKKNILKDFPGARISIQNSPHEHHE